MEFDIETIRRGISLGRERLPGEFAEVPGALFADLENKLASVLDDYPEPISNISIELFSEVTALAEASRYYYRMRGEELLDQREIADFLGAYINFLNSLVHWDVPPEGR